MPALILPSRFNQQPQYPVEVDESIITGASQVLLPSLGAVALGKKGCFFSKTSETGNSQTATPYGLAIKFSRSGGETNTVRQLVANTNFRQTGSTEATLIVIASYETRFSASVGATDPGLRLNIESTGVSGVAIDSPFTGEYSAKVSTTIQSKTFVAAAVSRSGTNVNSYYRGAKASTTTGNTGWYTASPFCIGYVGAADGQCLIAIASDRCESDAAIFEILNAWDNQRDAYRIFRKRPQILYFDVGGGGATDLTIADSTHSHSADNAVLTSSHLLTVADATHAHSADNVALSTAILLALADALHSHTADNLTLTLAGSEDLVIADASHAHTADSLSLTTLSVLVVAEALHSHLADNVVLSLAGTENLIIADAAHAHSADNLSLTSQLALSIAEATHAHTADGIVITSEHVLAVADALHAHLADNLTLSDAPSLTIAEASHGHSADNLALTMDSLLAISDAAHAHLADEIELTSAHTLAIVEAMHAHLADNVTLSLITLRAVELLIAAARDTQLTAAARDTTLEARYEFHG